MGLLQWVIPPKKRLTYNTQRRDKVVAMTLPKSDLIREEIPDTESMVFGSDRCFSLDELNDFAVLLLEMTCNVETLDHPASSEGLSIGGLRQW